MDLHQVKRYEDLARDRMYPGMFLFTCGFHKGMAVLNGDTMEAKEAVKKAISILEPWAVECDCFRNGTWIYDPKYDNDFEKVMNQTEENYSLDMKIMNLITLLKIFCNESFKTDKVYMAVYENDSDIPWYAVDEEITEQVKQLEEEDGLS